MIYFIIFILSFLFGIWVKISGEVVKLNLNNYTINIDLYFIIITCIVVLFLLINLVRFFSSISSTFINIKNKKRDKEEMLIFEAFFSIDLDNIENTHKLIKNLSEEGDKLLLVKTFNAGKSGDYSFFTNNLAKLANKSRNLAFLLSNKLIVHLKKDKIAFQKLIEYCSDSINDKILSLPFQIENAILKNDWNNAILKLKEAIRFNVFLSFDHKKMFAIFYCALAREYESKGDFKEAIKSVFKAQSHCATFQPINYLKVAFYIKLGKIRKASVILEGEYEINPTPQVAKLYISLNSQNAERLYSLRQDYYFSHCVLALSTINSGKYDLAYQHLNTAMAKVNYLSIYLIMVQLKILLQEYDQAIYWLNQIDSKAIPDPVWRCRNCNKEIEQWDHKCFSCKEFNCITIM